MLFDPIREITKTPLFFHLDFKKSLIFWEITTWYPQILLLLHIPPLSKYLVQLGCKIWNLSYNKVPNISDVGWLVILGGCSLHNEPFSFWCLCFCLRRLVFYNFVVHLFFFLCRCLSRAMGISTGKGSSEKANLTIVFWPWALLCISMEYFLQIILSWRLDSIRSTFN